MQRPDEAAKKKGCCGRRRLSFLLAFFGLLLQNLDQPRLLSTLLRSYPVCDHLMLRPFPPLQSRYLMGIRDASFSVHRNGTFESGAYPSASEEALRVRVENAPTPEKRAIYERTEFFTADLHVRTSPPLQSTDQSRRRARLSCFR